MASVGKKFAVFAAFWVLFCAVSYAAEPPVEHSFPTQLHLVSGGVLRNATAVRFTPDSVVVKHAGGIDPVKFTQIVPEDRLEVYFMMQKANQEKYDADVAARKPRSISGQVFVTTNGNGAYKFSEAKVIAYPLDELDAAQNAVATALNLSKSKSVSARTLAWVDHLKSVTPVQATQTDGDGLFTLSLPNSRPIFVLCYASRRLLNGEVESHLWAVPVSGDKVVLGSENQL